MLVLEIFPFCLSVSDKATGRLREAALLRAIGPIQSLNRHDCRRPSGRPMSFAREARPAPLPRHVINERSALERVPDDWALLPPGDAALSRRIKLDGPTITVVEVKGRKRFSRGIWAPAARIDALRTELEQERLDPRYARRLEAGRQRRAAEQATYVEAFTAAVRGFLNFAPRHAELETRLAHAIAVHATPVGSGTVARTERIPVGERAAAATIAWLRHQTTGYDDMRIERARGRRREVRRMLAARSVALLERYRRGDPVQPEACLLARALAAEPRED